MNLEIISQRPPDTTHPTPILFIHGAWHHAQAWAEHFLPHFSEQGYAASAVSLRGHGKSKGRERLRRTRLADYTADVHEAVSTFDTLPVLIGHSMGGLVVQEYLRSHPARAAVLVASVPPSGVLSATLRYARSHPLRILKATAQWSLWPLIDSPELAREYFFSASMPQTLVDRYFSQLQDESYLAFLEMILYGLRQPPEIKIPLLVLGAENDALFSPAEIERTASRYATRATIFPDMAHDMILEAGWEQVANHIISWLRQHNL